MTESVEQQRENARAKLAAMIQAGIARYEETVPVSARRPAFPVEPVETRINITIAADRQREICLSCPLNDCVGVESPRCPIRIEQKALWRAKNQ